MRVKPPKQKPCRYSGVTLLELIVFMVVISVALGAMLSAYQYSVSQSVTPAVRQQMMELAQSRLDDVMARRFDENTPIGGVPACDGSVGAPSCSATLGSDGVEAVADDVDDYHNVTITPLSGYSVTTTVVEAGTAIGLSANDRAKRVQVSVSGPNGLDFSLSAYRANF